ncbi:hypothetical protein LTR04_002959 [Oleoguttula sp. CCFEE 6159]|nr:hypothetical protein LTR04_002959 [Oleoguttula sp. CCFEE 6159]
MSLAPPFTRETAHQKVKKAQNLWNGKQVLPSAPSPFHPKSRLIHPPFRDPQAVAKAYTESSIWRNRSTFLEGQPAIVDFLTRRWDKEKSYRLRKELFAFSDDKIAVQFWYEYQDAHDGVKWKRCYGLEHWTFAADGRMRKRMMSGNDIEIEEHERWFKDGVDVDKVEIGETHW